MEVGNHPRIKTSNKRIRGTTIRVFVNIRGRFALRIGLFGAMQYLYGRGHSRLYTLVKLPYAHL